VLLRLHVVRSYHGDSLSVPRDADTRLRLGLTRTHTDTHRHTHTQTHTHTCTHTDTHAHSSYLGFAPEGLSVGVVVVDVGGLVLIADLAGEGVVRETPRARLQTPDLLGLQQNLPL